MGGTRFNARGINPKGFVANYVETEQILEHENAIVSHIQIRGSVPLFWRQVDFLSGPELTKSLDFSLPYTKKHFETL